MIFMCIFQYKLNENVGICFIHLLQEHSNFRNNHGNQYKCSILWLLFIRVFMTPNKEQTQIIKSLLPWQQLFVFFIQ